MNKRYKNSILFMSHLTQNVEWKGADEMKITNEKIYANDNDGHGENKKI
ncbi:hypothetical protein MHB48_19150 [Psychrobacillus sp. FSL H8-0483]